MEETKYEPVICVIRTQDIDKIKPYSIILNKDNPDHKELFEKAKKLHIRPILTDNLAIFEQEKLAEYISSVESIEFFKFRTFSVLYGYLENMYPKLISAIARYENQNFDLYNSFLSSSFHFKDRSAWRTIVNSIEYDFTLPLFNSYLDSMFNCKDDRNLDILIYIFPKMYNEQFPLKTIENEYSIATELGNYKMLKFLLEHVFGNQKERIELDGKMFLYILKEGKYEYLELILKYYTVTLKSKRRICKNHNISYIKEYILSHIDFVLEIYLKSLIDIIPNTFDEIIYAAKLHNRHDIVEKLAVNGKTLSIGKENEMKEEFGPTPESIRAAN